MLAARAREGKVRAIRQAAMAAVLLLPCAASAADTLAGLRRAGELRCGVSEGGAGFSTVDPTGRIAGLGPDFCRALAAATGAGNAGAASGAGGLGAASGAGDAVRFARLTAAGGYPALLGGQIDILVRATVWTLGREAALDTEHPAILYVDRQAVAVPPGAPADLAALKGPVCAVRGTHHADVLLAWAAAKGVKLAVREVDRVADFAPCAAVTSQGTTLRTTLGPRWTVLPQSFGDEPIGPVVRGDDRTWVRIVRAVAVALLRAEPAGITAAVARAALAGTVSPAAAAFRAETAPLATPLGLAPDWALRAVAAGGHYGEIFDATLGRLGVPRGVNTPWAAGGALPAPPFR